MIVNPAYNAPITDRPYSILKPQPYSPLFVSLSGSNLYGFPSADSDFDLRGVHVGAAISTITNASPCKEFCVFDTGRRSTGSIALAERLEMATKMD